MQGNIKICFVCTGNTCRSFMAERIMKKLLKDAKIDFVKVLSRGLNATGEYSTENACKALKSLGYSATKRKSVAIKKFDQKTLYIAMTSAHKNKVAGKVIEMRDLIGSEIPDPYGRTIEEYKLCAELIESACKELIKKLIRIGGEI